MKVKESSVIVRKIKEMENGRVDGVVLKSRGNYDFLKLMDSISNADIVEKEIRIYRMDELHAGPLFPFFEVIKEKTDKMIGKQIDDLIDKNEVYIMHREYFEGYLKKIILERNEEFFSEETEYAINEIYQSVIRILNFLYKDEKIIICIDEYEKLSSRSK